MISITKVQYIAYHILQYSHRYRIQCKYNNHLG